MTRRAGIGTSLARAASLALTLSLLAGPAADAAGAPAAVPEPREAREVRTVWTGEFGVPRPGGLAYAPRRGELLVLSGGSPGSVLRLGFDEDARGRFRLARPSNPGTLAFDPVGKRLTAIDGDALIGVAGRDLAGDRPPVGRTDISSLGLRDPQGASYDPVGGTLFILDAGAEAVVEVPGQGGTGSATRIPISHLGATRFGGIAVNPSDGRLYLASADRDVLYALDRSGAVRHAYDLGSLELQDPRAMVFAPSSDPTDAPPTMNLFIADAGGSTTLGGITEVTLAEAQAVDVPVVTASLVRTTATSAWNPGSPDPSGVVYLPGPDRLQVADSEVDETTGAGYHGVNTWQTTLSGTVTDTGTFLSYSKEPTGLGYDPATNTLLISDDSKRRVFMTRPGGDGRFGTGDDVIVSSIDAGGYGSTDTEDPEFDPASGHVFILDGVGTEIYRVDPVNGVFGDGNDVMTHFDVGKFGPTDFEGLASDPVRDTLLVGARKEKKIYEATKDGTLVRIIDASGIPGMSRLSGLAMAPASDGSGRMNYFIVDRAQDNGSNPSENDGKLFEITIPGSGTGNNAPIVTNPGTKTNTEGDTVAYEIVASDPDGDAIASYGATGLPTGLAVNTSTGLITGTTTTAGSYAVTISATDGRGATGSTSFTWNVSSTGPPSPPAEVLTFVPDADAYVSSANPGTNYGARPTIVVDNKPVVHSLLRFTVAGIEGRAIGDVKLRLYCVDPSNFGGSFRRVADNNWQEGSVTWNNAPAADATPITSLGSVSKGRWYEVDLTSLVTGDGTYSLRITSSSTNGADYVSKEGAPGFAPQLIVVLA